MEMIMALRLKKNPAPVNRAVFVSNPRKRKKSTAKKTVRKARSTKKRSNPKKTTSKRRKTTAKKKRTTTKKRSTMKKRKNPARKRRTTAKRRTTVKRRKTTAKKRRNPVRKPRTTAKRRTTVKRRKTTAKKRRNPVRKRRTTAKRRKNPSRKKTRIIRNNPMSFTFLKPVEKMISKVPVIGKKVAPYTQPIVIGMIGGAGVMGGMMGIGKIPYIGDYAKYALGHAFGYSVMGLGLALLSAMLPVKPATKKALAISFAAAGGVINASQLVANGFDLGSVKDSNLELLGDDSDSDPALSTSDDPALGDGGYWEVQPISGVAIQGMGGLAMSLGGADFSGSKLGDAASCPSDLSTAEGQAALEGRDSYLGRFGCPPHQISGVMSYQSALAGSEGHRWGWLIKLLGYERFAKLAAMPAAKRRELIAKLKAEAIASSRAEFDFQSKGMGGLAMKGMRGLAMKNMRGLAMQSNLNGIAISGRGI